MIKNLSAFWKFSRPHTIVGSIVSIVTLYLLAAIGVYDIVKPESIMILIFSLLAALACNVFIVGLNQVMDIEVDKINKPYLPLAAGTWTQKTGLQISLIALGLALLIAANISLFFFGLILLISIIGAAYSLPPFNMKANHFLAAGAITVVRGLLVNLGFFYHFRNSIYGIGSLELLVWPLTIFVLAFSLGIAWFKDIPDTKGDQQFKFGTLALKIGRKRTLYLGLTVVSMAFIYIMILGFLNKLPGGNLLFYSNLVMLVAFNAFGLSLNLDNPKKVRAFYIFFWVLFFAEYICYGLAPYLNW